MNAHRVPTAVLASGNGTNLQAVIDAVREGSLPLDIRIVVSNNPNAFALERARRAAISSAVLDWNRDSESRNAYALRLARRLHETGARLVLLLGWMHVLAPEFLESGFDGILNLHPSYLPDNPDADVVEFPDGSKQPVFRGPRALRDALIAKVPLTGASLIEITPLVDRGPVLARKVMAFDLDDNEASALERLHRTEHSVVREGIRKWLSLHNVAEPAESVPGSAVRRSRRK